MIASGDQALGAAIAAFLDRGFATLAPGVDVKVRMKAAFSTSRNFFELDQAEKSRNRLPIDLGYRPYGIEYSASPDLPDKTESFSVSYRASTSSSSAQILPSPLARATQEEMTRLFDVLEPIAEALVIGLANQLSPAIDGQIFRGALHSWSLLQMNRALSPVGTSDHLNQLHEDGCLLTIMANTGPGLEFLNPDGSFSNMTLPNDELLIIPGEILWLLSGGKIQPMFHRVRELQLNTSRMASLFFADIDPKLCIPWIKNEINADVDIGDRVLKNSKRYGLEEWSSR